MEQNPARFIVEMDRVAGAGAGTQFLLRASEKVGGEIEKVQKSLEKETDPNKFIKNTKKLQELQARKEAYDKALQPVEEAADMVDEIAGQQVENERNGRPMTEQEAENIMSSMEVNAEVAPVVELTPENWIAQFGEDGTVNTPIGVAKMGENQFGKLMLKGRVSEFGMIAPTLTNPDVIIEEASNAKDEQETERPSSYLFVKTFKVGDKSIKHYESVSVKKDGLEVVISNHYINSSAVKTKLTKDDVLYINKTLSSNSSDRHLAENPNGSPDLLPTREDNVVSSESKDNTSEPNIQANPQESSQAPQIREQRETEIQDRPLEENSASLLGRMFDNAKQRRETRKKVKEYQSYIDSIKDSNDDVTVSSYDDVVAQMKKKGCAESEIAWAERTLGKVKQSQQTNEPQALIGFKTKDSIFLLVDNAESIQEIEKAYIHERQHFDTIRRGLDNQLQEILNDDKQVMLDYIQKLGGGDYSHEGNTVLADEIISLSMQEVRFLNENEIESFFNDRGITDKRLIDFIKKIDYEQRHNPTDPGSGRHENNGKGNSEVRSQDEGNRRAQSSRELGQEGAGAVQSGSGRATDVRASITSSSPLGRKLSEAIENAEERVEEAKAVRDAKLDEMNSKTKKVSKSVIKSAQRLIQFFLR